MPVDVATDAQGAASCGWALDASTPVQAVEAALLESGAPVTAHLPLRFTAQLLRASEVAYDPAACDELKAAQANTVQKAIDVLCKRPVGQGCCELTVARAGRLPSWPRRFAPRSRSIRQTYASAFCRALT